MAIAIVIPLAMLAAVYTGRSAQQISQEPHKVSVVASFYPLYEFASRVVGDRAEVSSLVPAGVEPHDWEPTPQVRLRVQSADMLVINGAGFESWAGDMEAKLVVDTSQGIDHGANPHIWLDPIIAEQQVQKIRDALVAADPANTDYYKKNADRFLAELDQLDSFIKLQLADCKKSDFIAFHDAFTYFAKRYGLTQHAVHDVSPEGDILPQKLEQVINLANQLGINVIYSEDLVDSRLADTIAGEIPGGKVLVLSPVEGINQKEQDAGIGYIDKMRENVTNLRVGLECR